MARSCWCDVASLTRNVGELRNLAILRGDRLDVPAVVIRPLHGWVVGHVIEMAFGELVVQRVLGSQRIRVAECLLDSLPSICSSLAGSLVLNDEIRLSPAVVSINNNVRGVARSPSRHLDLGPDPVGRVVPFNDQEGDRSSANPFLWIRPVV